MTTSPSDPRTKLAEAVRDCVEPYTVPLALLRQDGERTSVENGSGVLLRIGSAHVVLTAGHVALAARSVDAVHIGIQAGAHRWLPALTLGSLYVPGTFADVGYMIIDPADRERPTIGSKLYAPLRRRITVLTGAEIAAKRCHAFVAGYPFAVMTNQSDRQGVRLLVWHTAITGSEEELRDVTSAPHSVGLVVPPDQYATFPVPTEGVELPDLGGVSGGGLWLVERDATGDSATLVGLHIGSSNEAGVRLARSVAIGHVLRLLAFEQPQIAEEIYNAFPRLRDDEWDFAIPPAK